MTSWRYFNYTHKKNLTNCLRSQISMLIFILYWHEWKTKVWWPMLWKVVVNSTRFTLSLPSICHYFPISFSSGIYLCMNIVIFIFVTKLSVMFHTFESCNRNCQARAIHVILQISDVLCFTLLLYLSYLSLPCPQQWQPTELHLFSSGC